MSFHRLSPSANRVLVALAVFTFASWAVAAAALLAWTPGQRAAHAVVTRIAERLTSRRHFAPRVPHGAHEMHALSLASASAAGFAYSHDSGDPDFAWGLLDGDGHVWMESGDWRRLREQRTADEPLFWFRDGDKEYVVRDAGIVAEVREATQPLRELGRQMGTLGREMGRQGAVMGRLGGRMGVLGGRLARVEARLATRAAARGERTEAEATLREMRAEMARMQREIAAEQAKHSGEQGELSRRMSELSARHKEAHDKARLRVRELAKRALREGKAERPHANA